MTKINSINQCDGGMIRIHFPILILHPSFFPDQKQLNMRRLCLLLFLAVLSLPGFAQDVRPSTFGISLTQENAFGFYPVIYGTLGLSSDVDLTFYGVMWTNPSFGLPVTTFSSDLWLENSVGIGFNALGGNAYINPALGFTHGKFLSGGDQSVIFEGLVPSLSMYFYPGNFESEIYFSLYQHLRDEVTDPQTRSTADFLFYWLTPGYKVSQKVSLGVHYEGVFLKFGDGEFESSYQWLGPYIKFRVHDKYDLRFAAGPNLREGIYADEFYKLSTTIPLE